MAGDVSRYEHTVGRYMLFGAIGAGGMATVHIGRRVGAGGFARLVAIKRLHARLSLDREVVHAFLDEARIAARVTHPNVVSIHDVVLDGDEVLLVMEYVPGRALSLLAGAERLEGRPVPPAVAAAISLDLLRGLQAAHEARDERGRELGVIHRDVSPHNVLVGTDGVARVLDFGIAKALGRLQTTGTGAIKGKLAYMAPERLLDHEVTVSVDIYAAAIVVWEMLAGARYFDGPSDETMLPRVQAAAYRPLEAPALAAASAVLERALRPDPAERPATASELSRALQGVLAVASQEEVAAWVQRVAGKELAASAHAISEIEQSSVSPAPSSEKALPQGEEPKARAARSGVGNVPETSIPVVGGPRPGGGAADAPRSRSRLVVTVALASAALALVVVFGGLASSRSTAVHAAAPVTPPTEPLPTISAPPLPVAAHTADSVALPKPVPEVRPSKRASAAATQDGSSRAIAPPIAIPTTKTPEPEAPSDRK